MKKLVKTNLYQNLFLVFGIFQSTILALTSSPGEDISQSRNAFVRGTPDDFLGAVPGLFYSIVPDGLLPWNSVLSLIQTLSCLFGMKMMSRSLLRDKKSFYAMLVLQNLFLVFSSQQSRDGTLFSFVILGTGILVKNFAVKRLIPIVLGLLIIMFALSFRPWIAFCALPLVYLLLSTLSGFRLSLTFFNFVAVSLLLSAPLGIEILTRELYQVESKYPEQTVYIHDLSSLACQSANLKTSNLAINSLSVVSTNPEYQKHLCQFYRPSTWQNVVNSQATTEMNFGLPVPLKLVATDDVYTSLFANWINTIAKDPKSYIQIKLTQSIQVLLSPQTQLHFKLQSSLKDIQNNIIGRIIFVLWFVVTLLWSLSSILYLFSIGIILLLLLYLNWQVQLEYRNLINKLIFTILFGTFIATIVFVSDNARYTNIMSLMTLLILLGTLISRRN
jgi:hypothetical protein